VFVSWFQKAAGPGLRLKIAWSDPATGDFGPATDLGLDAEVWYARNLAVAGVSDRAYAIFSRSDGALRFKRWSIGPGPSFTVTPHAARVIGPSLEGEPVGDSVIAAAGDTVAVAWTVCGSLKARVSTDRGQTWGPIRAFFGLRPNDCVVDFGASATRIAIRGDRIVLTYSAFGLGGPPTSGLIQTTNGFATRSRSDCPTAISLHMVGFVRAGGETKLADVFERGDRIRLRRQQ
jgi:hypothetical protein